jgi:hypothetical protein
MRTDVPFGAVLARSAAYEPQYQPGRDENSGSSHDHTVSCALN